jgi:hypothetical protein
VVKGKRLLSRTLNGAESSNLLVKREHGNNRHDMSSSIERRATEIQNIRESALTVLESKII